MGKPTKKQQEGYGDMHAYFGEVISQSLRNLDGYTDEHASDLNYIPEKLQPVINNFCREQRKTLDFLTNELEKFDKSSDEYVAVRKEMENIAKSLVNLKGDVSDFKTTKLDFKNVLGKMNKGTQDANHFLNSAVFGEVGTTPEIDKFGNLIFGMETPMGASRESETNVSKFKMKDMVNIEAGQSPIITEPYGTKNFVWKLAQQTQENKKTGASFDKGWTSKIVANNIESFGPNNTIGVAFTDLAGDNRTKSFAEQYEEGLKPEYYIHPTTGEQLPTDNAWMKDPANTEVLGMLLTSYITEVMSDIYGVIDSETGQVKRTPGSSAKELIEKYRNKAVNKISKGNKN
jgi:hypothetical protein